MSDSFPGTESLVCHVAYHLRTATVTILANPFAAALTVPFRTLVFRSEFFLNSGGNSEKKSKLGES
jgi:hypothetical protein